eukprot:TRINITY_DN1668_c0_g1_i1.p1 TRINITY_DN1668_c0_g1~~TRINITY_DN1668_c0_g1_i1.p1  ORF type:complete len:1409 (-),score=267.09 TRINITY_DN1668_c0_g1_i1:852-4718(-)
MDDAAAVFSPMLAQFTFSLDADSTGPAAHAFPLPPVAAIMAMLLSESRHGLLYFFLRQLSKGGVERDAARRALDMDRVRLHGKFLPSRFHELPAVRRLCAQPLPEEDPSAFALHPGYTSCVHALRLVLSTQEEDEAEALRILQGQSQTQPMPQAACQRKAALALALAEKSLAAPAAHMMALRRFLHKVPWMGPELALTRLVSRLLEPANNIPHAILSWLQESANHTLCRLVLHVLVLLFMDDGATPAFEVFRQVIQHGASVLDDQHTPGSSWNVWHTLMRQFPGGYHVYSCPNRHMYVTDGCANITNEGVCAECEAKIGGPRYGVTHHGNVRHGTIQEVQRQWDTHFAKFFVNRLGFCREYRDAERTENGLSPMVFRLIRCILESAMLGCGLIHGREDFHGAGASASELLVQLANEVGSVKDAFFADSADDTPACLYLHAAVARLFGNPPAASAVSWPLREAQACTSFEATITASLHHFVLERPAEVVRRLQDAIDESQVTASRDEVIDELKRNTAFIAQGTNPSLNSRQSLHWVPAPLLSLERFWSFAFQHAELAPVLCFLRSKEICVSSFPVAADGSGTRPSLSLIRHLPAIARFLRILADRCHTKITRAEAQVSFGSWLQHLGTEAPEVAHQIQEAQGPFEEALREVWPHIGRHPLNPCIDYTDEKAAAYSLRNFHCRPLEEITLELLLISDEGPVSALWGTLSAWQRDILTDPLLAACSERLGRMRVAPSLEMRPFACTPSDVVHFSSEANLFPYLAAHLVRNLNEGARDDLHFEDLSGLERTIVEHTGLLQKPLLCERLPAVHFLDEMVQSSVLASLEQMGLVQELSLPAPAAVAIRRLAQQDPTGCELLRGFAFVLAALAVQASVHVDQLIVDFVSAVHAVLDPRQHLAQAILERTLQLDGLRLSHLRALCASCWDGQVHVQFAREPDVNEQEKLHIALEEVRSQDKAMLPMLLAVLLRVGSEEFSYGRGWPETVIDHATGDTIPNPRLVCPGGSIYFSVIEPAVAGDWDNIPDAFMEVPITCFQAVLENAQALVAGSQLAGDDHGLPSSPWLVRGVQLDDTRLVEEQLEAGAEATVPHSPTRSMQNKAFAVSRLDSVGSAPDGICMESPSFVAGSRIGWSTRGVSLHLGDHIDVLRMAELQLQERAAQLGLALVETPRDGSCLFHALRHGQLLQKRADVQSILEMRLHALAQASEEQLAVAALDQGLEPDEYKYRMRQPSTWADELMLGLLAITQGASITVLTPTYVRTYTAEGTATSAVPDDAVWVGYDGRAHYYGIDHS